MTRYVLDSSIVLDATRPAPCETLANWLGRQADEDLFIVSLTLAEIRRGILEMPAGSKRRALERWFAGPEGPQAQFAGRVLSFDEAAALIWARLMREGTARGRPRNALDMMIAAVAEANGSIVVTSNEKEFAGLPIVNPLRTEA